MSAYDKSLAAGRAALKIAATRLSSLCRPQPSAELLEGLDERFVPDSGLAEWIYASFINEDARLWNEEHAHLQQARIACLWTNVENRRRMRKIAGTAEISQAQGGAWAKGKHDQQIIEWFGYKPDFLLTFYAPYCADDVIDDATWCALVEHELYHCAQAIDKYGAPKFDQDDQPVWAIRGHDVEEFVGVVARYGVGPASSGVGALVEAARSTPLIAEAAIADVCGTCRKF